MIDEVTNARKRFGGFALGLALCLLCSALHAQPAPSASRKGTAQALFERGKARMKEQKYAEAAALLEQSQAMDAGVGTRLYLAYCYEHMGRLASAWAMFHEAASAAAERGEVERAQSGLERAALLEPQIPYLVLRVSRPALPGLVVLLNGMELHESGWDMPLPVDPGESTIEQRAPGYQTMRVHRVVAAGAEPLDVELPALNRQLDSPTATAMAAPAPAPAPTSADLPPSAAAGPLQLRDETTTRSWQRPAAVVAGGAGLVALGIGSYFGLRAISQNDDAEERCPSGTTCGNATGVRYSEQANDSARLANGFLLGGALLAGAGLVLWLTAPSETSPRLSAQAGARSLGVNMTGTF